MVRAPVAAPFAVALVLAGPLAAQQHDHSMAHRHQYAFGQGAVRGLTIGAPQLDLNGGYYFRSARAGDADDIREGFIRLHGQAALGTPYLTVASDLLFLPGRGASPTWSVVGQVQPFAPTSRLYASAGFGAITGRSGLSDRLRGWLQGVIAVRTPVHEVTPFVQVGRALRDGEKTEWLFGVAHPIAPYRFHLP